MSSRSSRRPVSRFVTLRDGRRAHALSWPGRGTPLIVLHGLLDSAEGWGALCREISRPCLAVDLAGFGRSDAPSRPSFNGYADDVIAVMDALCPGDAVLVGHSLGGGVATAVAERLGDRVRALVLLAPAGFGRIALAEAVSIPGVRDATQRLLPLAMRSRFALSTAYRLMIAGGVDAEPEILDRILDHEGNLVLGAREATKAVVRGGLSKRAFHKRRVPYEGPVTVVWGDRDRLVPMGHMTGVARAFPHVDAEVWEGMAHHPQQERPAELAALVEGACRGTERPARLHAA